MLSILNRKHEVETVDLEITPERSFSNAEDIIPYANNGDLLVCSNRKVYQLISKANHTFAEIGYLI